MCQQNRLKRSFLKSNSRCISMPGLPMKVGNSADMVWVRSTTLLKLLVSAAGAGAAATANPVAAAPVKKLRRLKAARTFASHPATHISRSEEHTSELQSPDHLVCRLLLEKKKKAHDSYRCRVTHTVKYMTLNAAESPRFT